MWSLAARENGSTVLMLLGGYENKEPHNWCNYTDGGKMKTQAIYLTISGYAPWMGVFKFNLIYRGCSVIVESLEYCVAVCVCLRLCLGLSSNPAYPLCANLTLGRD